MEEILSQSHYKTPTESQNDNERNLPSTRLDILTSDLVSHNRTKGKTVRFETCTTDILAVLFDRDEFTFSRTSTRRGHCRPILKYDNMSEYFKRAGTTFARALASLGTWASGVTSQNPNVRSDMYKHLVDQIRSSSPPLRQAGESVLYQHIAGLWTRLVEDFSVQREEWSTGDLVLYKHAAQVIGIILTNHRYLEKLEILDVQILMLEIVGRVDAHFDGSAPLGVCPKGKSN
jgi:hypothetical protein